MTLEETNEKINDITVELQEVIAKGWVCGESTVPLNLEHQQWLINDAQAKVDKLQEDYIAFNREKHKDD